MKSLQRQAGIVLGVVLLAAPAAAQDVCVTCAGPDRTYRCQIAGADGAAPVKHADKVAQFVCISELARKGGHSSCKVKRDGFSGCLGDLEVLKAGGAQPVAPGVAGSVSPPTTDQGAVKPAEGPPKTMVELAKRTGEASKEQLDKTGAAVGGAMKKTWDCVSSFFTTC